MTTERRAAAFFDFDRTIIDGDGGVAFGWELFRIRRGRVRDQERGTLGWAVRNVSHETSNAGLLAQIVALQAANKLGLVKRSVAIRKAYTMMKGLPIDDTRLLAQDFFDEVLSQRLYPQARREMERHRAEGRRVVVVSTGMHIVLDPVRQYLPVDDVIACHLMTERGLITGEVQGPLWGKEKAETVREFAHRHELSLPRSWAYSDHISDLPFLQLVGHPVAVNPDLRLRLQARARKWPIERWSMPETKRLSESPR